MTGSPATTTEQTSIANNILMRLYILILFILFSFSLSGQHMMLAGGTQAAPPVEGLLLDDYPGAVAAYSLRELSSAWAGLDVIRVRESGSNTEQDFTAAEITDGTLATFCGTNDGFVVTWYDQSGNSNDATQAVYPPKIVAGGVLVTEGGKAALDFDGINDYLILPSVSALEMSIFGTANIAGNDRGRYLSNDASEAYVFVGNSYPFYAKMPGVSAVGGTNLSYNDKNSLFTFIKTTSNFNFYIDGVVDIAQTGSYYSLTINTFMSISTTTIQATKGVCQELIFYPSDQSANRTGIESNINTYYSIY